jgi:hypothetical protein
MGAPIRAIPAEINHSSFRFQAVSAGPPEKRLAAENRRFKPGRRAKTTLT